MKKKARRPEGHQSHHLRDSRRHNREEPKQPKERLLRRRPLRKPQGSRRVKRR